MTDILFVEDEPDVRTAYADILREAGFEVRDTDSAETALELIRQRVPDLVLLDISLRRGRMSGIELLARLRENPAHRFVPVVIFSGLGDIVEPDVVQRLRVADVVDKAVTTPDQLVERVRAVMGPR
jgi:CheY-like chemotaxis protein